MSNPIVNEGSEDYSSPDKNRLRRKWMRDNSLNTSWQSPIYEPNPSCLCDTCEKNYSRQMTPSRDPSPRSITGTSDEEDITDFPDSLFDGNENGSKSVVSCLSLTDEKSRSRHNITGESCRGEIMVVSDENFFDNTLNFSTLSNTRSDKDEKDEKSTRSEEMGLKNTKLKRTNSEGEENCSDIQTKDSHEISPSMKLDENERPNLEKSITREDKYEIDGADYKFEETNSKVYPNPLKFLEENDEMLNSASLFMKSVKDEQNACGKFINKVSEGERESSDREECGKAEISKQDPSHHEGYKKKVSLDQNLEKIHEGNYDENLEHAEAKNSDGLVILDMNKPDKVIRHPSLDKEYKMDDKFSGGGYLCRICENDVAYHFRKQIRERKRSGMSALEGVEVVNDEIPRSENEEASQDSTTQKISSCTAETLPHRGPESTIDGKDDGQGASRRAARASRNIAFNARTRNPNCRQHAFCRRLQTIITRNQNTLNSRGLVRRPLESVLRTNSRGLRTALRRGYPRNRRSLRALTFRDIVDRRTGAPDGGDLRFRFYIGAIRILLG